MEKIVLRERVCICKKKFPFCFFGCFYDFSCDLVAGTRSGTGHPGSRDHYLTAVVTFVAVQLGTRLHRREYSGRIISSSHPGSPALWGQDYTIVPAVAPVMIPPPPIPPTAMTRDHLPVSKKKVCCFLASDWADFSVLFVGCFVHPKENKNFVRCRIKSWSFIRLFCSPFRCWRLLIPTLGATFDARPSSVRELQFCTSLETPACGVATTGACFWGVPG